ncbi:uncharacterized protein RHO25_007144 [Cercospora beticola]|uniref:Uncharacterized protein n=1 Tax=Cercospora beticola TaxID=122368 RepID=A0ABZ0NSE6_CERBT|nr:hypothetical protein RHO25_007144 [Cercospora beticola]
MRAPSNKTTHTRFDHTVPQRTSWPNGFKALTSRRSSSRTASSRQRNSSAEPVVRDQAPLHTTEDHLRELPSTPRNSKSRQLLPARFQGDFRRDSATIPLNHLPQHRHH